MQTPFSWLSQLKCHHILCITVLQDIIRKALENLRENGNMLDSYTQKHVKEGMLMMATINCL